MYWADKLVNNDQIMINTDGRHAVHFSGRGRRLMILFTHTAYSTSFFHSITLKLHSYSPADTSWIMDRIIIPLTIHKEMSEDITLLCDYVE